MSGIKVFTSHPAKRGIATGDMDGFIHKPSSGQHLRVFVDGETFLRGEDRLYMGQHFIGRQLIRNQEVFGIEHVEHGHGCFLELACLSGLAELDQVTKPLARRVGGCIAVDELHDIFITLQFGCGIAIDDLMIVGIFAGGLGQLAIRKSVLRNGIDAVVALVTL